MSWFYTNQQAPTIVLRTLPEPLPEPWATAGVTHARCQVPPSSRPEALGVVLKPLHFTEVKQGHRDHPADGRPGASGVATDPRHPLHSDLQCGLSPRLRARTSERPSRASWGPLSATITATDLTR